MQSAEQAALLATDLAHVQPCREGEAVNACATNSGSNEMSSSDCETPTMSRGRDNAALRAFVIRGHDAAIA